MKSLEVIEKEMTELLSIDKKNWTHFYILLKEVETNELWRDDYQSFTQWVKDYAMRTKTNESIIWNRKKAGKVYESYEKVQKERGVEVPPIEQVNVSADNLVILDKINKYDANVASNLVNKVISKEITKNDLREIYKSIRPDIEEIDRNPHIKKEISLSRQSGDVQLTANDIVLSLCKSSSWLSTQKVTKDYFKSYMEQPKYKALTEFPVYTGTTRKSRQIDVLIIENFTTDHKWNVHLHGVEIKVSKHDLLNDHKYTEYSEFIDFLWLAVPLNLVDIARQNKPKDCGIISVEFDKDSNPTAQIIETSSKLNPYRRTDALERLVLKLL